MRDEPAISWTYMEVVMTRFTVKCTKGDGQSYTVKLGVSILEGVSDSDIRLKAEQSMIVDLQGKLRTSNGPDEIVAKLNNVNYVDAEVTGYVKTESDTAKLKRLLEHNSLEDIEAAIALAKSDNA